MQEVHFKLIKEEEDLYDKDILVWIHLQLKKLRVISIYRKITNKGTKSVGRYLLKEDVWRLNINEASSLFEFIDIVKHSLQHEKRIYDMKLVQCNLELREKKGNIWKVKSL